MTEMGWLLRNILPCLPCSSAQTPQHRQGQQQQRWCHQDGNTLSLEKIPCYKRTKHVSWTWNTLRVGLLDKNHHDKEQHDQQGGKPSVFFTIFTKSPLACLFFKPTDHEVKLCSKVLGPAFCLLSLFIWVATVSDASLLLISKHLWLSWSKRLAFCRIWENAKKV